MKIYEPKKEYTEKVTDEEVENKIKVMTHELWKDCEYYPYVIGIIDEWVKNMDSIDKIPMGSIDNAKDTWEHLMTMKKVKEEVKELKNLLS